MAHSLDRTLPRPREVDDGKLQSAEAVSKEQESCTAPKQMKFMSCAVDSVLYCAWEGKCNPQVKPPGCPSAPPPSPTPANAPHHVHHWPWALVGGGCGPSGLKLGQDGHQGRTEQSVAATHSSPQRTRSPSSWNQPPTGCSLRCTQTRTLQHPFKAQPPSTTSVPLHHSQHRARESQKVSSCKTTRHQSTTPTHLPTPFFSFNA